ncbi:putative membrane protein [Saonia flava]|uniref:Putative membrane protein n=1 Tax=Saonia flava TaxID=523696 RepID=A0A846R186_9FLAO|nr:MauE/DoxX family redox-associated membrane protein [Saonia flava]NJB70619.1 putative membrane protein [Saonia flava]
MSNPWHFYLMVLIYISSGLLHFVKPKAYMRIMPRYLPHHKLLVYFSGAAELLLGIGLCYSKTKNFSIYGIITMLLIFLLVHVYMLQEKKASLGLPNWVLFLRIPLQFVLMYWAYQYLI